MYATTIGIGPFHPAIKFNGKYYKHGLRYDNEDDAQAEAQKIVDQIQSFAETCLAGNDFHPIASTLI